jgi:hypothetical protein
MLRRLFVSLRSYNMRMADHNHEPGDGDVLKFGREGNLSLIDVVRPNALDA